MNRTDYFARNMIIFTIGSIGTKMLSFFLVPLYTAVLLVDEYGTIDLITALCTIAVPVITLNISESVMRFALDKGSDKVSITRIGTNILVIGAIIATVIIPISGLYPSLSQYAIVAYFYILATSASQLYLCDLRGKELLLQYAIGSILNAFLIAFLNIIFLLVLRLGVMGYFGAYIIANSITAIYSIIIGKGYKSFELCNIDINLLSSMIKYSVVLIPNSLMWWIMNSSDRIMITGMIGIGENGVYAVSYKLPTLVTTITAIFNQAWSYSAIKEEGADDEGEYNNKVFRLLIAIVMLGGIAVIAFEKLFLRIYVSDAYFTAWKYVPFLVVGCVYITLGTFMSTSYTVHKDGFGYLFSGMFGAAINVVLNFTLIPIMGVYGAALATCISHISVFIFRLFHTRKYIVYSIKCKEFVIGSVLLLIVCCLVYFESIWSKVLQIAVVLAAVIFYSPMCLFILKKIKMKAVNKKYNISED